MWPWPLALVERALLVDDGSSAAAADDAASVSDDSAALTFCCTPTSGVGFLTEGGGRTGEGGGEGAPVWLWVNGATMRRLARRIHSRC